MATKRWLGIGWVAMGASLLWACSETSENGRPNDPVAGQAGQEASALGGGGTAEGGVPGSGGEWQCDFGYALDSYHGDVEGLCPASESRWQDCCVGPGADVPAAIRTRCAPDNSVCVSGDYCTLYSYECGWRECDPDNRDGADETCPWDLAEASLARGLEAEDLLPCASDVHCTEPNEACNQRLANRMFCGPKQ